MKEANNIIKSAVAEVASTATDITFGAVAAAAGFSTRLALPLAKGLVLGVLESCFTDNAQKKLSISERKKLGKVSIIALETFRELAEKDGVVAWEMNIDPAYIDYAYEVAEHATLGAIRQSEKKKIDILGRYYGRMFYKGSSNWHDMHQLIEMVSSLTFRQLVMIKLINEGFKGLDGELLISNPSVCVEMNRLKDYGIWQTGGITFGINESHPIVLKGIHKTDYTSHVYEDLMLDKLSDEDIQRAIDSFALKRAGTPLKELTEEEYKKHTEWQKLDESGKLVLDDRNVILPEAEEQEVRDIVRKYKDSKE